MKPEIKNKWIENLRSGRFQQSKEMLYRPEDVTNNNGDVLVPAGYCCLGVLAVTLQENFPEVMQKFNASFDDKGFFHYTEESGCISSLCGVLPVEVLGEIDTNVAAQHYWVMNDSENKTFNEIADFIEENE